MTILDQLERTVTASIVDDDNNSAAISLLEQFYAILIVRLAQPLVYTQLLCCDQSINTDTDVKLTLFEQIWPQPEPRHLLISELSAIYHIDPKTTEQWLIKATHLTYLQLKNSAGAQYLPAFLQTQQSVVRPYLPIWAEEVTLLADKSSQSTVIETFANNESTADNESVVNDNSITNTNSATKNNSTANDDSIDSKDSIDDKVAINIDAGLTKAEEESSSEPLPLSVDSTLSVDTILVDTIPTSLLPSVEINDAIHASPSDYHNHHDKPSFQHRLIGRTRNRKSNLMVQASLVIGVLSAIGLAWLLVIKPNYMTPSLPDNSPNTAIAPVATAAISKPNTTTLMPAELTIGVDSMGDLYTCTAAIGGIELQSAIKEALEISFGEQAEVCKLSVQTDVANSLPTIDIATLPKVLMLVRSAPFALLKLQNNTLILEAPDETLLQRLLMDMRVLLPAVSVTTTPISSDSNVMTNADAPFAFNNEFVEKDTLPNNYYANSPADNIDRSNNNLNSSNVANEQEYQLSDDDTNDKVIPAPAGANSSRYRNNNVKHNNIPTPLGPMSAAEADNLANSTIVSEQLTNEKPVDRNLL